MGMSLPAQSAYRQKKAQTKKKHRQWVVRNDSPLPVPIANHERVEDHPEN
jgi:hypothetical protein